MFDKIKRYLIVGGVSLGLGIAGTLLGIDLKGAVCGNSPTVSNENVIA